MHSIAIVCPAQGKRILMCWAEPDWCPSNLVNIFPFNDDDTMGVLASSRQLTWASQTEVASKLETRQRYLSTSCHTFPWPVEPSDQKVAAGREAAAAHRHADRSLC